MSDTPLLVLEDLCLRVPERVLVDGVSIVVRKGRITAVVGASGSGKTVSARAAMGVIEPGLGLVRGSLRYPGVGSGELLSGASGLLGRWRLQRRTQPFRGSYVTYAPQSASSALNPGRTIGRQLQLAIRRRAEQPTDERSEIRRILDEVGLPPGAAAALPRELSGGMAQRAALATAIAPDPQILIADEPETGLDPVLRRVVTELMLEVASHHRVGLMLITHNHDTVDRIADEVVSVGRHA